MSESGFEVMRNLINSRLAEIESGNNIKIVYACESGSRAWGFSSANSDYDVRFIYIRPIEWYLSIDEKRDVIEYPINERLDINGMSWIKVERIQLSATLLRANLGDGKIPKFPKV